MSSLIEVAIAAPALPAPTRTGWSRLRIWIVLTLLVGCLVACFVTITGKQTELESQGDATRRLRMSWQAMTEVDVAILDIITRRERADMSRYVRAAGKLARYDAESFPPTVDRHGRQEPSERIIDDLKEAWITILTAAQAGQAEAARQIYVERGLGTTTSRIGEAAIALIETKDVIAAELQREIRLAVAASIVVLFLIGLFVYWVASRRSTHDRTELRSAMLSANAAREAANAAREQVTQLFQMTDMLQSAADHNDANAVLRATAAELIPEFGGALYVFSNSRDRLVLSTSWNRDGRAELPDTIGLQQCWSLKRGKPHINVPNSHKLSCEHFAGDDCMLEIPMIARGEILGLFQIYAAGSEGEIKLQQVTNLGSALADGMSLALANIALRDRLRGQALRDPLTGLYNRRYMEDSLERVVRLAEREHTEVSVIMIDLDHFKRLNDNYGHGKGDAVLRDAAAILLNQLRETDIACRYGGEELIVVMPNCGLEMAVAKAERLRLAIEALSEPNGAQISASMGVASVPSTSMATKDLLSNADSALYEAKQAGRNRVSTAAKRSSAIDDAPRPKLELVAAE